jgi:DNA-3-methyladenine glycosylase II
MTTNPPTTATFTITPRGPFSLAEAATFGFGQREAAKAYDGIMRLAFCVDGYRGHAAAEVRQDDAGVHVRVEGHSDVDVVRAQVARVLSLDHDGALFTEVGRRDPVIGHLQAVAPGLRPPLFYSPYEAAAWCVLSARRHSAQAAAVRQRLSQAHGATFRVAGQTLHAFPTPRQLLAVREFPGIDEVRLRRLHGVANAAVDWRLDPARLSAVGPEAAMAELRQLDGIGPFYSALIVIRASGLADVLPAMEPRLLGLVGRLYGLPGPARPTDLDVIGEQWRPLRTWAAVLIRAASRRLDPAMAA